MKKTNIIVIGNSHVRAFVSGWGAISECYPNVSIKFYGFRGPFYKTFLVDKESQTLQTSSTPLRQQFESVYGAKGHISFEGVDLILFVGGFTWWKGINQNLHSRQVIYTTLKNYLVNSSAFNLFTKVRKLSKTQARIVHAPFVASRSKITGYCAENYIQELSSLNSQHLFAMNARILRQPRETYGTTLQSKIEYATGMRGFRQPDRKPGMPVEQMDDLLHMNGKYGAVFLREIMDSIGNAET